MMVDTSATLKISVWRDFIPNRVIVLSDESDSSRQVLTSDSNLQEEVYSWHLREDALAGVSDENIRRRLREGLQRLDASRPPSERRVFRAGGFSRGGKACHRIRRRQAGCQSESTFGGGGNRFQ